MKALYFDGTKPVYLEDYPKPEASKGHSLIKVLMSAVCNTDREVIKGYRPDFRGVLGHEFVGVVEDSDDESLIGNFADVVVTNPKTWIVYGELV